MLLKKKLAVLGLAAVMTVAFMPAMAFAEEQGTIPEDGNLTGSETYKLNSNLARNLTVKNGASVILDLDGHTLTNDANNDTNTDTITVENGGTLTITDSSSTKGTIDNVSHQKAAIFNNGTVTIKGGVKITRSKETGEKPASGTEKNTYYNIVNHGNMTIDDASVNQNGNFSSLIENGYYSYSTDHTTGNNAEAPQLTIKGGTFSGGINTIKNDEGGDLTIDNGTFSNTTQCAVMNWNTATINGGTFTDDAYSVVYNGSYNNHASGKLTVNGGKYSGSNFLGVYSNPGTVSVTDGDFTGIKDMVKEKTNNTKFISGGTYSTLPTANLQDNVEQATVTNGTSTTYAVGEKDIQKAAEDSSNTVTITKGSVSLTGANAKIVNDTTNKTDTVTVDGTTVKAGNSVQPNAAQTIANLKNQIADLQKQIQAAASQGSTASANITSLKSDLAKAQAELKEAQAQVSEGKALLTAPGQVMNLKAKAGKRSAKLTWKAQTENTTGYRIYRKVKGGKYARVKTITKATQGSWTNKGLKKGKTYYFKVRAYKSITSGELWGAYSNTAKAKVK
ncbi:fibronectin type III domain-containing protein [Eubacterium pyruvativorans]|uniref:fibronectin type III domain-containing protein n=1 Tax=Eubacterium pyruvativorans TaxID=155865 RepID=UPI003F8BDFA5